VIRAYEVKGHLNRAKEEQVRALFKPYRQTAVVIARVQLRRFFQHGCLNRDLDIKGVASTLSERYKQTIQYQVVGVFDSFFSNRVNDFRRTVRDSSLDDATQRQLLYLNAAKAGYAKDFLIDGEAVPKETLRLARCIMRHILSQHRTPNLSRCNLALDAKVAKISPRVNETEKAKGEKAPRQASHFDYWVKLSTCNKHHPIWLALESNDYLDSIPGQLKNFLQINLDRDGGLHYMLIKEAPDQKKSYAPLTEVLPLGFGLRTLFATPDGGRFGRTFIDQLSVYDEIITGLARERQKQGLRVRSKRYDHWVMKLQAYVENEIKRVINRLVELYKPKKVVVEHLDFRNPHLSRRMNRLVSNCGRRMVREKLQALNEQFGIEIQEINAAYTSKECSECHYVAKNNRPEQAVFDCKMCGRHLHADVNSSRNHAARSSDEDVGSTYVSRQKVLQRLTERFVSQLERGPGDGRPGRPDSRARTLLQSNPYFADYFKEASPQKMACS
jgi:putative transposase